MTSAGFGSELNLTFCLVSNTFWYFSSLASAKHVSAADNLQEQHVKYLLSSFLLEAFV